MQINLFDFVRTHRNYTPRTEAIKTYILLRFYQIKFFTRIFEDSTLQIFFRKGMND